jgi:hypothetical protein
MRDPEWMVEHLQGDLAPELYVLDLHDIGVLDRAPLDRPTARPDNPMNSQDPASLRTHAGGRLDRYGPLQNNHRRTATKN